MGVVKFPKVLQSKDRVSCGANILVLPVCCYASVRGLDVGKDNPGKGTVRIYGRLRAITCANIGTVLVHIDHSHIMQSTTQPLHKIHHL